MSDDAIDDKPSNFSIPSNFPDKRGKTERVVIEVSGADYLALQIAKARIVFPDDVRASQQSAEIVKLALVAFFSELSKIEDNFVPVNSLRIVAKNG